MSTHLTFTGAVPAYFLGRPREVYEPRYGRRPRLTVVAGEGRPAEVAKAA